MLESKELLLLLTWSLLYFFLRRGKIIPTRIMRRCFHAQKVALVALSYNSFPQGYWDMFSGAWRTFV